MTQQQTIETAAKKAGVQIEVLLNNPSTIPKRFYCEWLFPGDKIQYDEKGKELIHDEKGMCCFNHHIGLPTRNWEGDIEKPENIEVELTHFNKRLIAAYHAHRKYSVNKCRGSGMSEILTIRYMIFKYGVLNKEPNRKCMILPGTSSKLTLEFSSRIKALCDKIPQIYKFVPTSIKPTEFHFVGGGRIMLMPATADAIRGFENVGDIIMEEVAHWDMVDDMPVYYASQSVHTKTQCHVVHATTPRGMRGFYYNLVWDDTATSDFYKDTFNWREIIGIPVPEIESLQDYIQEHGDITEKDILQWRKQMKKEYKEDKEYREWFDEFFEGLSFEQVTNVPIGILDINSIVRDSLTSRAAYDQELDNKFIASDNRAIGDFMAEDYNPLDLAAQLDKFDAEYAQHKEEMGF